MRHLTISDPTENWSNKACGRKEKIKTTSIFHKESTLEEKLSVTDDKKPVTAEVWNVSITLSLLSIYFK